MLVAVQLSLPGSYLPPVFKSPKLLAPPQMIISVSVQTAVWWLRASGARMMLVAVHVSVLGLYLPPLLTRLPGTMPPHTIMLLPVHTLV